MARKRSRKQITARWQPMERGEINPSYMERVYPDGLPENVKRIEVWGNDLYQATVEHSVSGWAYISFKRHDRVAARDWRHFQAIKNEVVGPEREAFEMFPAESRLVDASNQYHLWVLPEGEQLPFGQQQREILSPEQVRELNAGIGGKGRQRAWQPGLPTGLGLDGETTKPMEHPHGRVTFPSVLS